MKKIILLLWVSIISSFVNAANFNGIKIYINPGHGGWDANDRNILTIPYALGDTLGFYESKSNLVKGLTLRSMLQESGATVYMSRTQNRTEDDRSLSQIAAEANANNVDAFLSIHSNAVGSNSGTNYLLMLFHGKDNSPKVAQSLPMATAAWPRMMSNKLTVWTNYTTATNIRGDSTFYGTYGLGVLTPLTVPGFLSEGSFHDYNPETHRLLNKDYCQLEASNFLRYFCDYFHADLPTVGIIAGFVKGKDEIINKAGYLYKAGTEDRFLPLNGAKVKLMNAAGDSLANYQVDTLYNGIFVFHNLIPGTYKLKITAKDHTTKDTSIVVSVATTSYAKMMLVNPNIIVAKDTTPNYPDPIQEAGAVALTNYKFGEATPTVPSWLNPNQIEKVLYRNEKLYVLTKEPKILIVNAITNVLISEMKLTGISGGVKILSDIAFTADGYLLACNKDTISLPETKGRYFKVYTWDNDTIAPKLLYQTQNQAAWSNGVVGETMAVNGSRWKCTVYTPSVTTGSSKQIRIMGLQYEEGIAAIGYKYMMNIAYYTEGLWGKKIKFTISPNGADYFYLDSEKVLPTEFQFDWTLADRSSLINKGVFAEKSGYKIEAVASGNAFFRHAKHVFMASPVCNADSTSVGVVLFDISTGLNNALKVSEKLPGIGLGTAKSTYMAAAAKVTGYDIELMIMAQNEGFARFKTLPTEVKANIFASELHLAVPTCVCPNAYQFIFKLNEAASNVTINILKGDTIKKVIQAGALPKGENGISGNFEGLMDGNYTWSVTATAGAIDRPTKISDNTKPQLQFYSPRGVAVDNSFESEFFGHIYATETVPGTVTNRTTKEGIYVLDAALEDVYMRGAESFAGQIAWNAASSPMRLSVAPDGKVYVCDQNALHPGVWIMDPVNPSTSFKPVFDGLTLTAGLASKNGVNVHGTISHCWVMGTGATTKLFTFDKEYADATTTSMGNLLQYNIGMLETPWQSAPSAVIYNDGLNGNLQQNYNSCITPDARGGWWISQYRATDAATIPSLIHVDSVGKLNFNSGLTPALIANSFTGGMAVNYNGTRLAMGCQDEVKVFALAYSATGVPTLTRLHSIKPAMGTNSAGLAYDRAGNLYVISNSSERLGVWAMPKAENQFTTPAPVSQKIVITGILPILLPTDIVNVFPNPAKDNVMVECKNADIKTIELYDMNGRLLSTESNPTNRTNISVAALRSGIYMLKVKTTEGAAVKRIIKQ